MQHLGNKLGMGLLLKFLNNWRSFGFGGWQRVRAVCTMQLGKRKEYVWILLELQGDTEFLPAAYFGADGGAGSTSFHSKGWSEKSLKKETERKKITYGMFYRTFVSREGDLWTKHCTFADYCCALYASPRKNTCYFSVCNIQRLTTGSFCCLPWNPVNTHRRCSSKASKI